jgi:AcrR family transcriptional regulator
MPSDISRNVLAGPTTGDDGAEGLRPVRSGSGSARTREQLILAAEQLFAAQGIDHVSLRQINTEAGQRNSSAAHYHFGSKEALIRAIYDYRQGHINARRMELFDELMARGELDQPRTLVELLIQPVLEEIDTAPGGAHCIRFMAQVFTHPSLQLRTLLVGQFSPSGGRIYHQLHRLAPAVPDAIFAARFDMVRKLITSALAERASVIEAGGDVPFLYTNAALFVDNLVDVVEAILMSPLSAATARGVPALPGAPAA